MHEWASQAHNPQPSYLEYPSREGYWRAHARWQIQYLWEAHQPQIADLHIEGDAVQAIPQGKIELITASEFPRIYNILDLMKWTVSSRIFPLAYHCAQHRKDEVSRRCLNTRIIQETRNMVFALTSPERVRYRIVVKGRGDSMVFVVNVSNFL